jgi:hypothetical protein
MNRSLPPNSSTSSGLSQLHIPARPLHCPRSRDAGCNIEHTTRLLCGQWNVRLEGVAQPPLSLVNRSLIRNRDRK